MGKCGKWGADLGCSRVYRGCETSRAREFSPSTLRTIFRMHRARKVRWTRKVNYSGCLVTTTDCNTRGKCLGCQSCWETTLVSIGIRIFFREFSQKVPYLDCVFTDSDSRQEMHRFPDVKASCGLGRSPSSQLVESTASMWVQKLRGHSIQPFSSLIEFT